MKRPTDYNMISGATPADITKAYQPNYMSFKPMPPIMLHDRTVLRSEGTIRPSLFPSDHKMKIVKNVQLLLVNKNTCKSMNLDPDRDVLTSYALLR